MSDPKSRDRILDATLRLVAREGADAASLRRIGAEAGLHNSSLFHHFASKGAIHDALAERVIADAGACLARLAGDAPPRLSTLIEVLGDLAEHLAARPDAAAYLIQALGTGGAGSFAAARERATRALLEPIWQWLLRAREAGVVGRVRPQPTTLQLVGLVLLEPAWAPAGGSAGLRPATRARRRELDAWIRAALAPRAGGPLRGASPG